jgi:hypothetical protein
VNGQRIRNDGKPARKSRSHHGGPLPAEERSARMTPPRARRSRADRGQEVPYTGRMLPPPPRPPLQGGPVRLGLGRIPKGCVKGGTTPGAHDGMAAYRAHAEQPTAARDPWWGRPPRAKVQQRRDRLRRALGLSS